MLETLDNREIKIDKKEVLRYLGYGKNKADNAVLEKIEDIIKQMTNCLSLRASYEKYPLILMDDMLCFGSIKTASADLKRNLSGCTEVIVFCATIGIDADRIISKCGVTSPADMVIAQSVGATFIEAWCDILCNRFSKMEGKVLKPRFSPGYGDFPISEQKELLNMVDASRKIGVTLTESLLMMPSKSVSAIVGVGGETTHAKGGCKKCDNKNCPYRRD